MRKDFSSFQDAVETLQEKYPWHDFGIFSESSTLFKLEHKKSMFVGGFGALKIYVDAMYDDVKSILNLRGVDREVYHVFSLLSDRVG